MASPPPSLDRRSGSGRRPKRHGQSGGGGKGGRGPAFFEGAARLLDHYGRGGADANAVVRPARDDADLLHLDEPQPSRRNGKSVLALAVRQDESNDDRRVGLARVEDLNPLLLDPGVVFP